MKKFYKLAGITSLTLVVAACNGAEDTNGDETETGEDEINAEEPDDAEDDTDESMTAEEIIDSAIAADEEMDSFYMHSVMRFGIDGDHEDVPDDEESSEEENEFREWSYAHEDGTVSERTEQIEEGEPTEYTASDSETSLQYTEGDDVAYAVEMFDVEGDPADMAITANQLSNYLDSHEVTLEGEDDVNGYDTYHITFTEGGEAAQYWFDQETFIILKTEQTSEDNPLEASTEVLEYDLDIDYDEAFFSLEDVLPENVDIEDRDTDEHLEETIEESVDDLEEEDEEQ